MDTTFITIHDLSRDARLLYVSNSIGDILGYHPEEVVGKSCWDYFHPDEIPFAQAIHGRGVELDKAAVLNYCQIKSKSGVWIGCECVFTVVHDVMVGCTSIYRKDPKSQKRATEAPIIRQLFSSSPKDPRYHMLSYISSKFSTGPRPHLREPRAALFLNRFTRTLTIMYATNGLEDLLGISSGELNGKSFYYCIQENCLPEAVRCLESAKANDSIAYLRFWYRDPRSDDNSDHDETMSDAPSSDSEDGGVDINTRAQSGSNTAMSVSSSSSRNDGNSTPQGVLVTDREINSQAPSMMSTDGDNSRSNRVFDRSVSQSSVSSAPSMGISRDIPNHGARRGLDRLIELEAVVSCTSDGLVVILRSARPMVPDSLRPPQRIAEPRYANGLFAAPWGPEPIIPTQQLLQPTPFTAPHAQQFVPADYVTRAMPPGPPMQDFMASIREVAVFAWALTGINGCLAQYGRGSPVPGAQPFGGLPVWEGDTEQYGQNRDQMGNHMTGHHMTEGY